MNISKITSPIADTAKKIANGKFINSAANSIGEAVNKKPWAQKLNDLYEANGADNSFIGLATIMTAFVLVPRIKSALTRNPDDKEKTKDEVAEILFRDVQTILIVLFALKAMNTVVCNLGTKFSGIPMVNKAYRKLIDENATTFGEKAKSFIKNLSKNAIDTLNPIGGSKALSDAQIKETYTNLKSLDEVQKFLNAVDGQKGGKKEAVFNKLINGTIEKQNKRIKILQETKLATADKLQDGLKEAEELKTALEEMKKAGVENFLKIGKEGGSKENQTITNLIVDYFSDESNSLAKTAKKVSAWLKTVALGIEVGYLGFGLPALNQKRLEKKYLSEKPIGTTQGDTFSPFNDRHIKAQEIKLYGNFIK